MEDSERADSVANRDDPIPIIRIPSRDEEVEPSSSEADTARGKRDKLKEQAKKLGEVYGGSEIRQSFQDRFFQNVLSKVVPSETEDDEDEEKRRAKLDRRSRKYVERPQFSFGLANSNFQRFNARIGIVFVMQNRLIHLFTWKQPKATLSFLAVYSLLCLEPHLLPLMPLIGILFCIMTPSFVARHPMPANDPRISPSFRGPAIAPPSRVKPAPAMSKDSFRNMRDLQNCMEDFSRVHDALNEWIVPYTNFSDEKLSSGLYTIFFALSCVALIGANLIPWKFVALAGGWVLTLMGHPDAQAVLLSSRTISQLRTNMGAAQSRLRSSVDSDILLDEPPERRQVEIFELQKYHAYSDSWEPWLFSPSPYDPLSPLRLAGARAKGTQFFEDVQAPASWVWKDKKWRLDLASREWVEQRMITGIEIETEGERWVYDLPQEELEMLEGSAKGKKQRAGNVPKSGWEEGNGLGERGEWRRRRWVRFVEKKAVVKGNAKPG